MVEGIMTPPSPSMPSQASAAPAAFRILLRDIKRYDSFEVREFDLPLDATFPIGRASKNSAKQELLPCPSNAYIDSPVISRDHAVLTANTAGGIPRVCITDSGSMHGTMLNGRRLVPNTPEPLVPGDVLQFGIDVNRNDEFFVARNYEFDAHLSTPYSLGFTVPDPESEDEVEVEDEVRERLGSHLHPLMIDESDSASEMSDDAQAAEDRAALVAVLFPEEPAAPSPAPPTQPQAERSEPAAPTMFVDETYSEEEADAPPYTSMSVSEAESDEDGMEFNMDSEAGSAASSEADYSSQREVPDSEDEQSIPPSSFKITSPYTSSNTQHMQSSSLMSMQPTVQPRDIYTLEDMTSSQAPGLPPLDLFQSSYNSTSFADTMVPPLPPRPSAPKQAPWHNPPLSTYAHQNENQAWYPDQMSYLGTNFGDRPSIFSPAPPPPAPDSFARRTYGIILNESIAPVQHEARLQTPPPAPAADVTPVSPPPNRRTKVFSIEEIVEEQPQPPTPTSLNGTKRKADALEEPSPPVATWPVTPDEAEEAVATAAETAAIIAQRPKKQPRSIMGKVLRGATYPLLGAAGAVVSFTLLSTLPDAFFGA